MPKQRLDLLFKKCLDQTINEVEKSELYGLLADPSNAELIQTYIGRILDEPAVEKLSDSTRSSIISSIVQADAQPSVVRRITTTWMKYAAAVLILAAVSIYYFLNTKEVSGPAKVTENDVAPG